MVLGEASGTKLRKDGSGFHRKALPARIIEVRLDGARMLLMNWN